MLSNAPNKFEKQEEQKCQVCSQQNDKTPDRNAKNACIEFFQPMNENYIEGRCVTAGKTYLYHMGVSI